MWFLWFWWCWGANNEAVVDFSLVLPMFRETWFGSFWRVFGPMDVHDFRVCDFALFYCVFWMNLVCWGGLKGWNCDPRGGFKAKVDNQDSTSWGPHFGGSASTKIMKFHDFKNAVAHCRVLIISCFWGAIVEVQWCIFIKKTVDVCKNLNSNIAKHWAHHRWTRSLTKRFQFCL